MIETAALVVGTLPLSALHIRSAPDDAPLLLGLYGAVVASALAAASLPAIQWRPDTGSLFGVESYVIVAEPTASDAPRSDAIGTGHTKKRPL